MRSLFLLLLGASVACAQGSINTSAGGDQTYNAYGLKTDFTVRSLSGWAGVGYNGGMKAGGYLRIPLNRTEANQGSQYHLDLGDLLLPATLDTDDYATHSFSIRGAGVSHDTRSMHAQLFSGLLLEESLLPFMRTGDTADTKVVALSVSRRLSDTFQVHSLSTYAGGKVTSIQSFGWKPAKSLILSGAGGIGAGSQYGAVAGEYLSKLLDLRTSYIATGSNFERQQTPYYNEEAIGLNARASFSPIAAVNLYYAHDHDRTVVVGYPTVTGVADSGSVSINVAGFTLNPSASTTTMDGVSGPTKSESMSVSRAITSRWRAFGSFINLDSSTIKEQVEVAVNEIKISSRLMITQDFNRMDGQNTFSVGGQWMSNLISLSAEQETYVSPMAEAFGGKPVFQAWTFSIRLRMPHGSDANLSTTVDPAGRVRWGGYLSGLKYSSLGPRMSDDSPSFSKFIVEGRVVDEATGLGMEGIAVQIGRDIAMSNSSGEFHLDVKNTKAMSVQVLASYSTQVFPWRLIHAPTAVRGQLEKAVEPIRIIVTTHRPGEEQ